MAIAATHLRRTVTLLTLGCVAGCSEEPPPPSVEAFMEDPILLEATMVRCVANRNSINYDPECVNAREAVERIAAAEAEARRAALEAESERKREALRRAQEAADEARRRAAEEERLRREAELLGLTAPVPVGTVPVAGPDASAPGTAPAPGGEAADVDTAGAEPVRAPQVTVEDAPLPGQAASDATSDPGVTPADGGRAPGAGTGEAVPGAEPAPTDLGAIREELEQRRAATPPESS
jgi:hypothetical protein